MKQTKIMFVSLGCDKNLADTEHMMALLADKGYIFVNEEEQADIFIVNTCCFIHDAKEESIQTILELAAYRENGSCKGLIVTGCLGQRYVDEMAEELPEVDAVLGTTAIDHIVDTVEQVLEQYDARQKEKKPEAARGQIHLLEPLERLPDCGTKRMVTTGGHYAYLKISEGCDKHCSYCIIPKVRGDHRSVPMEQLVEEAELLAAQGVKELILVAQETTIYGTDLYGRRALPELLERLCAVDGICWIRLLYCYPEEIDDALIRTIREQPRICHYLDLPIQHCNDTILRRMGRRTDKARLTALIRQLRTEIPDIVLRTSLITGFPGETEEMFQEMLEFVDTMEFDRLGVFAYSPEEGTPAAEFPGQIPEEEKARRRDELMSLQQEVIFDKNEKMKGRKLWVMTEGYLPEEGVYAGRSYMDAPGVDGLVFFHADDTLVTGDLIRVEITGAVDYDLTGEPCGE